MFRRLSDYYRNCKVGIEKHLTVIWGTIVRNHHSDLCSILDNGTEYEFLSYMGNIMESGGLHGLEEPSLLQKNSARYNQFLERLAIKVGVDRFPNPEQPSINPLKTLPNVGEIEAKVGGAFLSNEHIQSRMFHYLAAAFDIRMLWRGGFPKRILEIGPGLGNLGMISKELGSEYYSIIDLPTTSVISAYFLSKSLGESNIWLYGEGMPNNQFVRVYPATRIDGIVIPCDLAYNSDSLTEMPPAAQEKYLVLISESISNGGMFFSINHESDNLNQVRVIESVKKVPSLKLLSRSPFMMRDGYIQEVYYV